MILTRRLPTTLRDDVNFSYFIEGDWIAKKFTLGGIESDFQAGSILKRRWRRSLTKPCGFAAISYCKKICDLICIKRNHDYFGGFQRFRCPKQFYYLSSWYVVIFWLWGGSIATFCPVGVSMKVAVKNKSNLRSKIYRIEILKVMVCRNNRIIRIIFGTSLIFSCNGPLRHRTF